MSPNERFSRRSVLKTTSGAFVGLGATGLATAASRDTVEVNVGYSAESGRKAALAASEEVVREFAFDALTLRLSPEAVTSLAGRADVRYVERNGTMRALCNPGCGYDRIDADVAYENGYDGAGADVAVLDTGIDSDHPNLQANLGEGKAIVECQGCNGNACNYPWDDDHDHGSHVSGIACATPSCECRIGVAPEATLHAVKVLDCNGRGSYSDIAAGLQWVADQGYDVANMSLGSDSDSSTLHDAVKYAHENGVTQVAAAGNDGPCTDCIAYPAKYDEVIAVGSVNCSDLTLSTFSSTGPEMELVAPGEDVYSTVPGGCDQYTGTSMAAPFVSGAAALLRVNGYGHGEARQRLQETAEDIGLSDNEQGHGLVDVAAALGLDSSDN